MPRVGENPLEQIKADIEKRANLAAKEIAGEVTFQIEKAYENAIWKFYNDYNPKHYKRTESTLKASNRWDDIFGYTPTEDSFIAGIEVGFENIPDIDDHQPYRDPTSYVFERTYERGIHGYTILEARKYAKEKLDKYVLSKKRKNRLANYINSAPPLTSPPPKDIMEKMFSRIETDSYLNKLSKDKLDELFG